LTGSSLRNIEIVTDQPQPSPKGHQSSYLDEYRILDSHSDTPFDRIARLAALIADTPLAAVASVDGGRIWFKAGGSNKAEFVPEAGALCDTMLGRREPLIISDFPADPHLGVAALARQSPHVRFFVGIPLTTPDAVHLGALCVMDQVARPPPTAEQLSGLRELGAIVVEELQLQRLRAATIGTDKRSEGAHRNLLAAYAAKSEFLASLSHELRTPLNAIAGYAGLIAGADDTPATTAEQAGEIMAAARHMLALVNDILEYSRLEAGTLPVGWQRVELRTPVEEALRMVSVFASSRGVRLTSDFSWSNAIVRGDPVRIKQVLLNLLTNAIKFTPRDGLVSVALVRAADGQAQISITDTGIGIAEGDIPKTLTPFGQIVPKEGGLTEGTGLGLPIAKALVERHGGVLIVESQLGQGTVVLVRLPALPPPTATDDQTGSENISPI